MSKSFMDFEDEVFDEGTGPGIYKTVDSGERFKEALDQMKELSGGMKVVEPVKGITIQLNLDLGNNDKVKKQIQEIAEELKKASYYANELVETLNRISVEPDLRNYIPTVPSEERDK